MYLASIEICVHFDLLTLTCFIIDYHMNSQIVIATTLEVEMTIVLDSCILFYMFTHISDMHTKYVAYNVCNINKECKM